MFGGSSEAVRMRSCTCLCKCATRERAVRCKALKCDESMTARRSHCSYPMPFADPLTASAHELVASLSLPSEPRYVTKVQEAGDAATLSPMRVVAVHEWIPMGSLATRTQCRCCHCGVTRSYDLSSEPAVSYARYGQTFVTGPMDSTEVPACLPQGRRMPPVIAARSWDILSWAQQ